MAHDDHHAGFRADLRRFEHVRRREFLVGAAGVAAASLSACEEGGSDDAASSAMCPAIPAETAGPFPGDGSNGPDALGLSGIVRRDIRSTLGGAQGVAQGVELTMTLILVDRDCRPLEGYAVYLWHCDAIGRYSMYGDIPDENYLRGVQTSDADGVLTFTTIFPGCYPGRWPHMHFEVFASIDTLGGTPVAVSQLALGEDACRSAYERGGYEASAVNLVGTSLDGDGVFRDGYEDQLAEVDGSPAAGFAATLELGLDV